MVTKTKNLTKRLQDLEARSKIKRAEEKSRIKKLKAMIRGVFIDADKLQKASWDHRQIRQDGLELTVRQVRDIYKKVPCPCGNCGYYAIEVFDDGRYIVHHHSKGEIKNGRYK